MRAGVLSERRRRLPPSASLLAAISNVSNAARTDQYETDVLFPVVYEELKRLAHHRLRTMGADATICTRC